MAKANNNKKCFSLWVEDTLIKEYEYIAERESIKTGLPLRKTDMAIKALNIFMNNFIEEK